MEAIVAVYSDWGIGDGNTQPVTLKADRAHFVDVTAHDAVICGRRTMEDFPGGKPLKGRHNIVLTKQDIEIPGAEVVHSVEEALTASNKFGRCLVIGGASVYNQMYPYLDKVYITKINCLPRSEKFFPNLDEDEAWSCSYDGEPLTENGVEYKFCIYERRRKYR